MQFAIKSMIVLRTFAPVNNYPLVKYKYLFSYKFKRIHSQKADIFHGAPGQH